MKSTRKSTYLATVRAAVARHHLLRPDGVVIVAVSGGADSVALLSALVELGYNCEAAHCNYHLRGEESMRDMRYVIELCHHLGVDLHVRDFDVGARMTATGESLEMACRELRYRWFDDLLEASHAQAIAVAHHREDSIETFMINALRGSGVAGLSGMPVKRGMVVRPAIDTTRAQIEEYLHDKGLAWVDDSSNAGDDFLRNRVRHHIVPMLKDISPGALDALVRTMGYVADARTLVDDVVDAAIDQYYDAADCTLRLADLLDEHPRGRIILCEMLRRWGFNATQAANMAGSADKSGLVFDGLDGRRAELDRGIVRFVTPRATVGAPSDAYDVDLRRDVFHPVALRVAVHPVEAFNPRRDPNVIYLDASALEGRPLWQIRRWRRGDRLEPYGMHGSKLVSDIFADAHFSAKAKREAWLLTRDEQVVWVIGMRAWRHYCVGPDTTKFVQIEVLP